MLLDRPFAVVTPTVDGDVLTVLARADAEFTAADLHRLTPGWSLSGVRKALGRLVDQGIVEVRLAGRTRSYRLNRDHLAAPAVQQLATLRDQLLDRIRDRLTEWDPPCETAVLFGSAARGPMHSLSDIDLFVVRLDEVPADDPGWRTQLDTLERDVTAWTGNDTRVLEMSSSEAADGFANAEAVLGEIQRDGITLTPLRHSGRPSRRIGR